MDATPPEGLEDVAASTASHEERIAIEDLAQRLLNSLEPALREVVALKYIEGLSDDEIATRLFISASRVRGRVHTVRKRVHLIVGREHG